MKCPHCNRGELKEVPKFGEVTHMCNVCGRGWHQDEQGLWHSHFATDIETYSKNGKYLIDRRY